jgi:hypothetical protein
MRRSRKEARPYMAGPRSSSSAPASSPNHDHHGTGILKRSYRGTVGPGEAVCGASRRCRRSRNPRPCRRCCRSRHSLLGSCAMPLRESVERWKLDAVADDAELVVAELVANAVCHARANFLVTPSPIPFLSKRSWTPSTSPGEPRARQGSEACRTGEPCGSCTSTAESLDLPEITGPRISGCRPLDPFLFPGRDHRLDQYPLLVR